MKNIHNLPHFKYHPNLYLSDNVIFKPGICDCCGKETHTYIDHMYTREDVQCICLHCVASGEAAAKFNGSFISRCPPLPNAPEKADELNHRTPGYHSWQGESWLACCDDYCAFLGYAGVDDLREMGIFEEVSADFLARNGYDSYQPLDWLTPTGSPSGYLFQCLHCGKYHIEIDFD